MIGRPMRWVLASAALWACVPGCCCTTGRTSSYVTSAPPAAGSCGSCGYAGWPVPPRVPTIQYPPVPGTGLPAGGIPAPMPSAPAPPALGTPQAVAPAGALAQPPAASPDQPVSPGPGVRLSPPQVSDSGSAPGSARLYPPQTPEPPPAARMPPAKDDEGTSLPVDIPQFALAKPRVASGQQPLPDGIAWLKSHGYRTVLHVRAPRSDDSAAQAQFEKQGLRYLSLELSADTLTKEVVDAFIKVVQDEKNQPLFVYDADGSRAGALWYLYFRLVDGASDEKARAEAARVGFRQDGDDSHRTMWLAVQNYLKDHKP